MNCPKCNADVADNATFCDSCGYKLSGDGQLLSTNAAAKIQDKSAQLFERVTYSTVTKVLFFSTLLALVGGILGFFSLVEGAYAYVIPAIVMIGTIVVLTIKAFVDIDTESSEALDKIIRLFLTFFAYSLFLSVFAGLIIGVAMLIGSWKYAKVIAVYSGLISAYAGVIGFSLLVISVIYMVSSVRANHK